MQKRGGELVHLPFLPPPVPPIPVPPPSAVPSPEIAHSIETMKHTSRREEEEKKKS